MTDAAPRRRSRGGGGAARRAERTSVKIETAKYIERNIPNYEVLTEEALEVIEANAETILEEVGVNFVDNPAALDRWREAGADVQGERVRIPRGLARKLCATAPSEFTQHARNPEKSVVIGGKNLVLAPVYGPPFARCQRWPSLCNLGRFPEVRETGLYVEVVAPLWRDRVRADGCAGEQTSPRHVDGAYGVERQTLYGISHRAEPRAGFR